MGTLWRAHEISYILTEKGRDLLQSLEPARPARRHDAPGGNTRLRHTASVRVRWRPALVGVTLLAATATSVQADGTSRDNAVVARNGGVELIAHDDDNQLCLGIQGDVSTDVICDTLQLGRTNSGVAYVGVWVPVAAARLEVRRADQLLVAAPTVAGASYKGGQAGKVRFALVRLPAGARVDGLRVRALDAAGMVVAVLAPSDDGDLVIDRAPLLSGRSGRVRWSIDGIRASALRPSVIDVGGEAVMRCSEVRVRHGGASARRRLCVGDAPRESLEVFGDQHTVSSEELCSRSYRLLHGLVEADVRRVRMLLGDGTTRSAQTASLPGGERVAYAIALPRRAAVRSITFDRGAAGSRVLALALAPLAVNCATGSPGGGLPGLSITDGLLDGPVDRLPVVAPVGPVSLLPGPPAVRVADGPGDALCLAIGDQPFTARSCDVPSPAVSPSLTAVDDIATPRSFALLLPARVAAIRVGPAGGASLREIATVALPGYAGRYAGHVRIAVATFAAARDFASLDLLDAAGNVLTSLRGDGSEEDPPPRLLGIRRIAGRPGHPSLWQTATDNHSGGIRRCLALTSGPRPQRSERCQTEGSPTAVLVHASCVTHRLTLAVAISDPSAQRGEIQRAQSAYRVFADVGARRARAIPLRAGAAVLTLPSTRGLRSVTFVREGKREKIRVDAPRGAAQCGWSAAR